MSILEEIVKYLPVPDSLFDFIWTGIGWQLGSSFGKINQEGMGVDEYIQTHGNFKGWSRFVLERVLHFIHHWEIGGLLIVYYLAPYVGAPYHTSQELLWLGLGLFLEDAQHHGLKYVKGKLGKVKLV